MVQPHIHFPTNLPSNVPLISGGSIIPRATFASEPGHASMQKLVHVRSEVENDTRYPSEHRRSFLTTCFDGLSPRNLVTCELCLHSPLKHEAWDARGGANNPASPNPLNLGGEDPPPKKRDGMSKALVLKCFFSRAAPHF